MTSFAIIPAAGHSRRMGRPKLLLPWGATTVLEHVIGAWRASRVDRVLVVVQPDDNTLAELAQRGGAEVVRPVSAPPEMKDSVRAALHHLAAQQPFDTDAWLLAPADMPEISPATIDRLIAEHTAHSRDQQGAILVPVANGRRGHPVLFPWTLAAQIDRLGADEGLNALLKRHRVIEVESADQAVPAGMNTPAEYEQLRARLRP